MQTTVTNGEHPELACERSCRTLLSGKSSSIILPVRQERMNPLATTRMSSKGQIVIPEEVRNRLGLEAGVEFVVVGEGDAVILKVISPPSKGEFKKLLARAKSQARKAGLKKKDLETAVRRARAKR